MALTLHVDASDTDQLFTTLNGGGAGVHTGTPGDGDAVEVWNDEGDGIADVALAYETSSGNSPLFRSGTPLMELPCLDFDGTDDVYRVYDQIGTTPKTWGDLIDNNAFTIIIAFYAESITTTGASAYANHGLIGDSSGGYFGIYLKDDGGQRKAIGYNYDGSEDTCSVNISEATSHVVQFRRDGTNIYISVDGGSEASVASGNLHATGLASGVRVGRGGGGMYFNGRVGEMYFYDTDEGASNATYTAMQAKWLGGGGDISGTAAVVFGSGISTLTGAGALLGSSAVVFGAGSTVLTGAGALAGSSAIVFAEGSTTLTGAGALAGSSVLVFGAGSSTLIGSGELVGSSAMTFAEGSTSLTGAGALLGSSALVFGDGSTILTGAGALVGSTAVVFTVSGTAGVPGEVTGTADMTFTVSGTATNFIAPSVITVSVNFTHVQDTVANFAYVHPSPLEFEHVHQDRLKFS